MRIEWIPRKSEVDLLDTQDRLPSYTLGISVVVR